MDVDSYENGVPSWVDLGSPDIDGARAFYSDLFGWDIPVGPPEGGGYSIATLRERPVAGIGPQMNPGPPVWMMYVNVDSADDTVGVITANGGQVLAPAMDVMEFGRMAVAADPTGAAFSIWQPRAHNGAAIVNEPNTFSWVELATSDVDAAKAFYGAVFGWTHESYGTPDAGGYTESKLGGRSVAGIMARPPGLPAEVPNYWGVYFLVDDTDKAVARVSELGGTTVAPPMDIEPGRFAVVTDPAGAMFNVMTLKEPH
ncbi:MAG TPA: VOC family protein [Acidimicrobiales bacterium]